MTRKFEPVTRERETAPFEGIKETHPCFGMARLSRVQGCSDLFGSEIDGAQHYITLTITRAERHHDYGQDRLFGRESLIEVAMSESQFASLITNWNMGEGTPVTLERVRNGKQEMVPGLERTDDSETARAEHVFNDRMSETLEEFKEAKGELHEILDKKGTIGKKDRERIRAIFWRVDKWFNDAAPYAANTFVEATERAVQKAKTEIDAFVTNVIHKTGLDALKTMRLKGDSPQPLSLEEGE